MESNRNIDMKAEKQLASFLDEHFYSRLHDKNGISVKFDRKKDKTSQLQGIDVELNADGKTFIIDEKASFYYSNAMIPTFASSSFLYDTTEIEYRKLFFRFLLQYLLFRCLNFSH